MSKPRKVLAHGVFFAATGILSVASPPAPAQTEIQDWAIYITNDNCPDYTWGFGEEQTRLAFAEIVRAHLDEMQRTDPLPPECQDRYNMAVTEEAICFLERYPERREELVRRVKEGRLFVSPFLCNSLWGFQSIEGAIRTLYPARRLEREWGVRFDVAEHIELPSLPWGVPTLLSGCGLRWISIPFLDYDCTFGGLTNPPLLVHEGPDGSQVRVILDSWASRKANYTQGAYVLKNRNSIATEWLPQYEKLGEAYPLRSVLASGTHGDISPTSGRQARGFAQSIIDYNQAAGTQAKLVNATLAQFCQAVDEAQARKPFLQTWRGCFGHSWELWPVSLAESVARLREGERQFLAAEALVSLASLQRPELVPETRFLRERAEWCWAMLSDHAWNGTDLRNQRHNAELRSRWAGELNQAARQLGRQAWNALGWQPEENAITLFNSLSFPRTALVDLAASPKTPTVYFESQRLASQMVDEEGGTRLYFVAPTLPGFGLSMFRLGAASAPATNDFRLRATPTELESPFYRLTVDLQRGGIVSLVHKPSRQEWVRASQGYGLGETIYFDGREHRLTLEKSEVLTLGPVLARLHLTGARGDLRVSTRVTVYAELDQVDFDIRIHKPVSTNEYRVCQVFPVATNLAGMRLETPAAVIRPRPQPEGDLLPGADPRRFAVQGFVDVSPGNGLGLTLAPWDAFLVRLDLAPITFEAIGNDQNYREVSRDQNGVVEFRFRYSLRAHASDYDQATVLAWSRAAATPVVMARGRLPGRQLKQYDLRLDPSRAIATCLKPVDAPGERGLLMRLWETAGRSEAVSLQLTGFSKAMHTDLLEREIGVLPVEHGKLELPVRPLGLAAVRLELAESGVSP